MVQSQCQTLGLMISQAICTQALADDTKNAMYIIVQHLQTYFKKKLSNPMSARAQILMMFSNCNSHNNGNNSSINILLS